jgi:hypothetical protein
VTTRVSAKQKNAGLTHLDCKQPTLADAKSTKNYLLEGELRRRYLISEQFLSFAELTVESKKTMTMAQWSKRLDDILSLNDLGVLNNHGTVSHAQKEKKVKKELTKYKQAHKLIKVNR